MCGCCTVHQGVGRTLEEGSCPGCVTFSGAGFSPSLVLLTVQTVGLQLLRRRGR